MTVKCCRDCLYLSQTKFQQTLGLGDCNVWHDQIPSDNLSSFYCAAFTPVGTTRIDSSSSGDIDNGIIETPKEMKTR